MLNVPVEVADTLSQLKVSTKDPEKPKAKPKSTPVAESWDDELSSGSSTETETESQYQSLSRSTTGTSTNLSPLKSATSNDLPNPPPPTPASPTAKPFDFPEASKFGYGSEGRERSGSGRESPARRPEKTTAVAGRLIAGALGVRAPKRTEEEREYDKAMREKEKKRRDEERDRERKEKEAAEARKRSVWED